MPQKKCSVDDCECFARRGGVCAKHGAGPKECSERDCTKFSRKGGKCLKHGGKVLMCKEKDCENIAQRKGLCTIHGGAELRRKCSIDGCKKYARKDGLCDPHNETREYDWKVCTFENCERRFKYHCDFMTHMSYVHDIGDKTCDYCLLDRHSLYSYQKHKICRICYRKVLGKDSRIEKRMSDFLDVHFGTEYLLGSDNQIYGEACQRYRPDKIYASPELVLHIECDEHQHSYKSHNYSCDEKRISDIYDEFPGKKYIIIRWNPDTYAVPTGKTKLTKKIDKMRMLLKCMKKIIKSPPDGCINIIYMFYNNDNDLLSKNISHILIYDENDLINKI